MRALCHDSAGGKSKSSGHNIFSFEFQASVAVSNKPHVIVGLFALEFMQHQFVFEICYDCLISVDFNNAIKRLFLIRTLKRRVLWRS